MRLNLKNLKIKSLVAWSISAGRMEQRQIFNFVRPYENAINQLIDIIKIISKLSKQ